MKNLFNKSSNKSQFFQTPGEIRAWLSDIQIRAGQYEIVEMEQSDSVDNTGKGVNISRQLFVNVKGHVKLNYANIGKLPVRFNRVWGDFICHNCHLTSLDGAPLEIKGDFNCSSNYLTSLAGSPKIVLKNFNCSDNLLVDLKGCPLEIHQDFDISRNDINTLAYFPQKIKCFIPWGNDNLRNFDSLAQVYEAHESDWAELEKAMLSKEIKSMPDDDKYNHIIRRKI